jgi:hypothetical protein
MSQLEQRNAELQAQLRELSNLKVVSATTAEAYERLVEMAGARQAYVLWLGLGLSWCCAGC